MSEYQQGKIKDINEENLIDETRRISELLEEFNFVSMV
jgi:hypothetical protein